MDENTLSITNELHIPHSEITYRFSRSGGPGGQHVNRSETRVELLWDVQQSPSLSEDQRLRLLDVLQTRIDDQGVLHLVSGETRSQDRNRKAVMNRFITLLQQALRPRRTRKKTRVSKAAKERRREEKRRQSEKKRSRRGGTDLD
jgi:ribosome-associated protein